MFAAQPASSPLPPLLAAGNNDDDSFQRQQAPLPLQRASFGPSAAYEGAAPVPTNRLFEAKAVNLVQRPKTSSSHSRSSTSPGLFLHPAPRHDNDMVRSRVQCSSEHQNHQQKSLGGGGGGGVRGEQTRGSNSSVARHSSTSADAEPVSQWSMSGERLSTSASSPSGVGSATQDRAIPTSPDNHHHTKGVDANGKTRGKESDHAANETSTILSRSNSVGSSHSQARAQTVSSLRRTSSNTSEAFRHGGGGFGGSANGALSAGTSVATSNDPDVLKIEIQRLQAALMNGFKGGNRFIGGAQFKSSSNSRGGHGGGGGGNSCGGCLQVREALRRSRVESRDLRASLFRAEDVIKQLTLTKAARRRGAHNSSAAQRDASSPLLSSSAATGAADASEKERRLISYLLASGNSGVSGGGSGSGSGSGGREQEGEKRGKASGTSSSGLPGSSSSSSSSSSNCNNACPVGSSTTTMNAEPDSSKTAMPSQESLLKRVQQLERELRLADFRNTHGAVGHRRRISAEGQKINSNNGSNNSSSSNSNNRSCGNRGDASGRRPSTSSSLFPKERASASDSSSCVRGWEDPQPCPKCSALNDRLLGEATKVNGLMRRFQEQQLETKRLREELVGAAGVREQAIEMKEKVDALAQQAAGQAREKDKAEEELSLQKATAHKEIERLVAELDRWRTQSMEYDGQAKRASQQHEALREEILGKANLLEGAEKDLADLRAALEAEKALNLEADRTAGALRRKIAEERAWFGQAKGELAAAKAARRHSETQAAAADVAHRRALKAALNSCVRLCVVAPTVNINLDDRSRSFCSGLPEEKIRAFVEGSVLPRFTRVLLQPGSEEEARGRAGDATSSAGRRGRRRERSSNCPNGGGNTGGSTVALRAGNTTVIPAVTLGPSSLSSPSSSPSNPCTPRRSGKKALAAAAGSPSTASAATAVDNPAVDQRQLLAESDDDEVETDEEGGVRGGVSGSGQRQGDFDKWLRDLLVDMQTSIERHVASVFQTQTAAVVP
eukprot:g9885.t1